MTRRRGAGAGTDADPFAIPAGGRAGGIEADGGRPGPRRGEWLATASRPAVPALHQPTDPGPNAKMRSNLPASNGFVLLFHPERWHVRNGKVRPHLGQVILTAGAGGAALVVDRATRETRWDLSRPLANAVKRGFTPIPFDFDADLEDEDRADSYLAVVERPGSPAPYTCSRWALPKSAANGVVQRSEVDDAGLDRFLDRVAAHYDGPEPWVLERLVVTLEDLVDRAERNRGTGTKIEARRVKTRADLEVARAALEASRS